MRSSVVEQQEQIAQALEGHAEGRPISRALTASELEVLRGAAIGEAAWETADRLQRSVATVKTQRRKALRRLGAKSIAQGVFIAREEIAA